MHRVRGRSDNGQVVRCTSGKHQVNVKSQSELDIGGCETCNDVSLTFLSFELQKCFSSKNWSEFNQEFISGLTLLLGSLKAYSYRAVPRYLFYITLLQPVFNPQELRYVIIKEMHEEINNSEGSLSLRICCSYN